MHLPLPHTSHTPAHTRTLGAASLGEGNVMGECSGDEARGNAVGGEEDIEPEIVSR